MCQLEVRNVGSSHPIVIRSLEDILESTQQDNICRRAAYILGKINPGDPRAIATLEQLIHTTTNSTLQLRTAENLIALAPNNETAITILQSRQKKRQKTTDQYRSKTNEKYSLNQTVTILEQRLAITKDAGNQRRIAYRLARFSLFIQERSSVCSFHEPAHFDQNLGGLNNYIGHDASFLIQNLRGLRKF
jgi:hypothetical protein